jgi:hypothetical protein
MYTDENLTSSHNSGNTYVSGSASLAYWVEATDKLMYVTPLAIVKLIQMNCLIGNPPYNANIN